MKTLKLTLLLVVVTFTFAACGGSSNEPASADGFGAIEKDIKSKFSDNAYFTKLTISYDKSVGNLIGVTVTEAPESLKMEEWNSMKGTWTKTSDVTLEVSEGSKAADFMFQLDDKINLTTLGGLVEKSIEQLKAEKSIEKPVLEMAFVSYPDNGDISKAKYVVMLEPENGGTSFTFFYKLSGEFIEMDY